MRKSPALYMVICLAFILIGQYGTFKNIRAQNSIVLSVYVSDHTGKHALYDQVLNYAPTIIVTDLDGEYSKTLTASYYNETFSKADFPVPTNNTYQIRVYWLGVLVHSRTIFISSEANDTTITIFTDTTLVIFNFYDYSKINKLSNVTFSLYRYDSIFLSNLKCNESLSILLPYGDYRLTNVTWSDRDVTPANAGFSVTGDVNSLTLVFRCKVYSIYIRFIDKTGKPVSSNLRLVIYCDDIKIFDSDLQRDDLFLDKLPQARYSIYVYYSDSLVNVTTLLLDKEYSIRIVIPRLSQVVLEIVDWSGNLIPGVCLEYLGDNLVNKTSDTGIFKLKEIMERNYTYIIKFKGKKYSGTVSITGDHATIKLPIYTLNVVITLNRKNISRNFFSIRLIDLSTNSIFDQSLTSDFSASFQYLSRGIYKIVILWYNYPIYQELIEVPSKLLVEISINFYQLFLVITDKEGRVVPKAVVKIILENSTIIKAISDEEGKVGPLLTPFTHYQIEVFWHNFTVYSGSIEINRDSTVTIRTKLVNVVISVRNLWKQPIRGLKATFSLILVNGSKVFLGEKSGDTIISFNLVPVSSIVKSIEINLTVADKIFTYTYNQPIENDIIDTIDLPIIFVLLNHAITLNEMIIGTIVIVTAVIILSVIIGKILEKKEISKIIYTEELEEEGIIEKIKKKLRRIIHREEF